MIKAIQNEILDHYNSTEIECEENFILRKKVLESISILKKMRYYSNDKNDVNKKAGELKTRIETINNAIHKKYIDRNYSTVSLHICGSK